METERRGIYRQRARFSGFRGSFSVKGVPYDRVAEMLEVETDLMGATGNGAGFEEGGVVIFPIRPD
jgi:hypothetical protein